VSNKKGRVNKLFQSAVQLLIGIMNKIRQIITELQRLFQVAVFLSGHVEKMSYLREGIVWGQPCPLLSRWNVILLDHSKKN